MLCCLLIALFGAPVVFWTGPGVREVSGQDCCTDSRRVVTVLSVAALALVAACAGMFLLEWLSPVRFHHICSVLAAVS